MPPKKPQARPGEPKALAAPPPGFSVQLWELSKDVQALIAQLKAEETLEDVAQGCSKAQVCTFFPQLWVCAIPRDD